MAQTFEGKSTNGSIQEALDNAIQIAKDTMKTDMITWQLEKLSGQDGGIVQVYNLSVLINATAGMHK